MKIIQIVDGYKKGDGVGNVVSVIDTFLKKNGFETQICNRQLEYYDIQSELFERNNVVFYHCALLIDPVIKYLKCKKVFVFHNITDPELLVGTDEEKRIWCAAGLYDTEKTADYFDVAITFSDYSKKCLIRAGWKAEDVFMLPILVRFDNLLAKPSQKVIDKYKDDCTNILFTGRVYPNKKHEDIIAAFAAYKELFNKNARLFLVGSIAEGNYYSSLLAYTKKMGIADDVIFPGHVSLEEYLAYYKLADLYLCMSAHEGFCIPLVEAMYFHIPILAYASTAIPDTLEGSGVLLYSRKPEIVAKTINRILSDPVYMQVVVKSQEKRVEKLIPDVLENQYLKVLNNIIDKLRMKEIISVVEERNKYVFSLVSSIAEKMKSVMKKYEKYVIYGAGAAGARLYNELKCSCDREDLILCDSFKSGNYEKEFGCYIISPEEAVKLYKDDAFIISIQDKRSILDISLFLVEKGIQKEQILIYDKLNHRII